MTSSGSGPEGGKLRGQQRLAALPPLQQVPAIQAQFLRQVLGRDALGNAAQDLHDGRARVAGFGPDGAREEIEDGATDTAAVVQDRDAMAIMGGLIAWKRMPVRTVQSIRM